MAENKYPQFDLFLKHGKELFWRDTALRDDISKRAAVFGEKHILPFFSSQVVIQQTTCVAE